MEENKATIHVQCPWCRRRKTQRWGHKNRKNQDGTVVRVQRYHCQNLACGRTFLEDYKPGRIRRSRAK